MASPSDDLREFYDVSQAAEAAGRWPLLQQVWRLMDGERLAPTQATKLHVQPPPSPPSSHVVRDETEEQLRPLSEEPTTADQPAPSLEDLFGRLR